MNPATTPDFVFDAIPGARKLADAHKAASRALSNSAAARNAAAERARQLTSGHLLDPMRQPAPGVAKADWDAALDAYRVASDEVDAAETALRRAEQAFERHVRAGMSTDDFKTQHNAIADAANDRAREAYEALKDALKTRDEVNRLTGRRLNAHSWYGIDYHLRDVEAYINAQPSTESLFYETATGRLEEYIGTATDRKRMLDAIATIDALNISDADKLRKLKTETGL